MTITPSKLREDIYNILDTVLEKGEIIEVKRRGEIIRIMPPRKRSKLSALIPHPDAVRGESEDLVTMDWSEAWKPFI